MSYNNLCEKLFDVGLLLDYDLYDSILPECLDKISSDDRLLLEMACGLGDYARPLSSEQILAELKKDISEETVITATRTALTTLKEKIEDEIFC